MSTAFQPAQPVEVSTVIVDRVEQRQIDRRDGTKGTVYQVHVVGAAAPLETFKRDLAESAFSLVGQQAEVHFTTRTNGQYTNYRLEQILPAAPSPAQRAQMAQEASPLLRQATGLPEAPVPSQGLPEPPAGNTGVNVLTEKDRAIHRQVAAKVAAQLVVAAPGTDSATYWENIERLAAYFDTGIIPGRTADYVEDDIPF
jgi:hypothetical protein